MWALYNYVPVFLIFAKGQENTGYIRLFATDDFSF